MATYYEAHEGVYRRLEAEGHACWDRTAFDQFTLRPFLEQALEFLGALGDRGADGAVALDVGCGTGPVAAVLHARGFAVVGVDVSATAVRLAAARFADVAGVEFVVGDVLALAGDAVYDLAVDAHCFHCIVFDDERARFLSTLHRLLKPGGALVVETMVGHDDVRFDDAFVLDDDGVLWRVDDGTGDDVRRVDGRFLQPQRRLLSAGRLRAALTDAGFVVELEQVQRQALAHEPWSYQAVARKR